VEVCRFGAWRLALGTLAAASMATLAAWGFSASDARPATPWIAVLACLGTALLSVSLARVEPGVLCRDGGQWTFAPAGGEPEAGEIAVALDLGAFLLLSFTTANGRRAKRWLPVQRAGLETDWHGLRCAVHAPQTPLTGEATPA